MKDSSVAVHKAEALLTEQLLKSGGIMLCR